MNRAKARHHHRSAGLYCSRETARNHRNNPGSALYRNRVSFAIRFSDQPADLSVRTSKYDTSVLNMQIAAFVTVVAIVLSFAVPTSADDRPSDPFGDHTIELNNEAPLVEMWETLRDKVLLDRVRFSILPSI